MAIEYVDPREIEKDPAPAHTAAHRAGTIGDNGRLAGVDSKLRDALLDLQRQIERLATVNAGLFGSDPADPGPAPGTAVDDQAGLVVALETRPAELRRLISRLEAVVEETASLT